MSNTAINLADAGAPAPHTSPRTREAVVRQVLGPRMVFVEEGERELEATVATVGAYRPAPGDRVLVLCEGDHAWVVGVVGALRAIAPQRTRDGVSAEVDDANQTLTVRGPRGHVLFQHDSRTGRSVVVGQDLELLAERTLSIEAGREVRVRAPKVELGASDAERITFEERGSELRSGRLRAVIAEGRFSVREAIFAAERVESAVKRARRFVDVLELRAGRIVEHAKDSYREVDGVSQTRAGRVRTVVKAAYTVLAQSASIKAEDDLALMGEKIHLA